MVIGAFTKQPNEQVPRAINFAPLLASGELIVNQTVSAKDLADGTDVTATLIAAPGRTPTTITARIMGGVTEHTYRVQMRATTNAGNVYEHEFDVLVREV